MTFVKSTWAQRSLPDQSSLTSLAAPKSHAVVWYHMSWICPIIYSFMCLVIPSILSIFFFLFFLSLFATLPHYLWSRPSFSWKALRLHVSYQPRNRGEACLLFLSWRSPMEFPEISHFIAAKQAEFILVHNSYSFSHFDSVPIRSVLTFHWVCRWAAMKWWPFLLKFKAKVTIWRNTRCS